MVILGLTYKVTTMQLYDQNSRKFASITSDGELIVQNSIGDLANDAWGIGKVSYPTSLFHGLWTFDIDPDMWFMYHNSIQVYSSNNILAFRGAARLSTDSVITQSIMESRETPRYQPNRGHLFSSAGWCPDKYRDGIREWGLIINKPNGEIDNGIFFRLKPDGNLYACRYSGGVMKQEDLIDTSRLPGFDVTKNNIYDIQFQWRSAGDYSFYIGNPAEGISRRVHKMKLLGTLEEVSMENPALPASFRCTRGTEDVVLHIGCADITSENGSANNTERYISNHSINIVINLNTPVLVTRQPLYTAVLDTINGEFTYKDVANTQTFTLARISATCTKKGEFYVYMTRDPSAFTGGVFKSIKGKKILQTDSPDTNATASRITAVDLNKLDYITSIPVEANVRASIDNPYRNRIEFPIVRGDYLVVLGTSSAATATCVVEGGLQI